MGIDEELNDKLLADYEDPEDLIGEQGLLKQLTKALRDGLLCERKIPPAERFRSSTDREALDMKLPLRLAQEIVAGNRTSLLTPMSSDGCSKSTSKKYTVIGDVSSRFTWNDSQ